MKGSVLVTGGARRIGLAICEELSARGWNVLSHSRDLENPLASDFAKCDAAADRLFAAALEAAPDLCAIVNNAALFEGDAATLEAVNLIAPRKLTTLLAGREDGVSSVVNILDSRTLGSAESEDSPYVRTKRALLADTRKFAALFAQTLRVNAVAPGPVLPPEGSP